MSPVMCRVFIGLSVDGFIADSDNGIEWLDNVPNPDGSDFGYAEFTRDVDAIVMGRGTYETVLGFGEWPFELPVVVMTSSLTDVPEDLVGRVEFSASPPPKVVEELGARGLNNLYIDGGAVITSFLDHDLIDEMTLAWLPVVLGGGIPLFGDLSQAHWLEHVETKTYEGGMVQTTYRRSVG